MSSSSQPSAPVKLISLDGGGVRGISSMMILQEIMNKVKELEQEADIDDNNERLPYRYFDLAGGASTGGLAAMMLFRLEMSASEVIYQYQSMASTIFSQLERGKGPFWNDKEGSVVNYVLGLLKNWSEFVFNILYYIFIFLGASQYSGRGLIEAVDKVAKVKEHGGGRALLLDDSKPKTLLFTTIHEHGSKGVMRSYTPPKNNDGAPGNVFGPEYWSDITLQQAARATTSAPYYFPSAKFKGIKCVDGGLLNNNPVERIWDARYELGTGGGKAPHVSLVLSLGTAKPPLKPIAPPPPVHTTDFATFLKIFFGLLIEFFTQPGSVIQTFYAIIDLATNTEEPHRDFEQQIYYRNLAREEKTHYFRFNAEVDEHGYIELDDVEGMQRLKEGTKKWLERGDVRKMVNECAQCLAQV